MSFSSRPFPYHALFLVNFLNLERNVQAASIAVNIGDSRTTLLGSPSSQDMSSFHQASPSSTDDSLLTEGEPTYPLPSDESFLTGELTYSQPRDESLWPEDEPVSLDKSSSWLAQKSTYFQSTSTSSSPNQEQISLQPTTTHISASPTPTWSTTSPEPHLVMKDLATNISDAQAQMALHYLQTYNFFGANSPITRESDLTDQAAALKAGMALLQRKYGLEESGQLTPSTLALMVQPRCGNLDVTNVEDVPGAILPTLGVPPTSAGASETKHHFSNLGFAAGDGKTILTYKFINFPASVSQQKVRNEFQQAVSVWSSQAALPFSFQEASDSQNTDVSIVFYDDPESSNPQPQGYASILSYSAKDIHGAPSMLHYNEKENWKFGFITNANDGFSFRHMTVHQLGHVLGLAHTSASTMNPLYSRETAVANPSANLDSQSQEAIAYIYATPSNFAGLTYTPSAVYGDAPDICTTNEKVRAIVTSYMGELVGDASLLQEPLATFIFVGNKCYKLENQAVAPGYPQYITQAWTGLPSDFDYAMSHVVFITEKDKNMFTSTYGPGLKVSNRNTFYRYVFNDFFKGSSIWRYTHKLKLAQGFPKSISLVYPGWKETFKAAFQWFGNGGLYMLEGDHVYYRYDVKASKITEGYPRPLTNFKGLPSNVDTAFTGGIRTTYFVAGDDVHEFSTKDFKVISKTSLRNRWLSCSRYMGTTRGPNPQVDNVQETSPETFPGAAEAIDRPEASQQTTEKQLAPAGAVREDDSFNKSASPPPLANFSLAILLLLCPFQTLFCL